MNNLYRKFTVKVLRQNETVHYYRYRHGFQSRPGGIRWISSSSSYIGARSIRSVTDGNNVEVFQRNARDQKLREHRFHIRNILDSYLWSYPLAFQKSISLSLIRDSVHLQNLSWIQWLKKNIPRGFEDFFPDGMPDKKEKSSETSSSSATPGTTSDANDNKDIMDRGVSSKDNNNDNQDNKNKKDDKKKKKKASSPSFDEDNNNLPGLIALLLILVTARTVMEQPEEIYGEEITFNEFRNQFLLRGAVEKLVVINQKIAQVVIKPDYMENATTSSSSLGLSSVATFQGMMMGGGGSGTFRDYNNGNNNAVVIDQQDEGAAMRATSWPHLSSDSSSIDILRNKSRSNRSNKQSRSYYFYIGNVENLEEKLTKAQASVHPESWIEVQYIQRTNWGIELLKTLPFFAFVAALYFGTRGVGGISSGIGGRGSSGGGGMGSIFSVGKSTHKKIKPEDVSVTFADVAGCDQAKLEIMEFVDFLKDADRFTKLGAKIPKGALLSGPPGTGKTLLAKATAGEAGVPFYSISGSDFIEMFVGVGPSRVRDLFKEARANAPCIVFIDEIDAVGRQRGRGGFSGGNDERENTLNQLLVEMDGFSPTSGVVVLAGTNRADILDQALTRPGRFDRQILVDKPDLQGRKDIFKVHLKGIKLENDDTDEYASRLAGLTPGFAGADIANICNEAAIVAARRKAEVVTMADFEKATDRIIGGLESNKIMSPEERSIVAHHEAGHAVAGWFLEHADPLLKVTIIPRSSGALGFAQYLPKEVFLRNKDQIMDVVCMTLAGRAAEQVFFGRVTTGASDDLRRVTQIVYSTIRDFGMNDKVGQLAYPSDDNQNAFGGSERHYSDSVAEAMDDEARSIVEDAYQRTLNLIQEHKDDVTKVAKMLLEKETVTHDDIYELVGPRPFAHDSAYQQYVTSKGMGKKIEPNEKTDENSTEDSQTANDDETPQGGLTPGFA